MVNKSLIARIEALERRQGAAARTGLLVLEESIAGAIAIDKVPPLTEVVAVEVGPDEARQRVDRRPGESLADLEARANPRGCWRAYPSPVFAGELRPYAEREEAFRLALTMNEGRIFE